MACAPLEQCCEEKRELASSNEHDPDSVADVGTSKPGQTTNCSKANCGAKQGENVEFAGK